MSEELNVKIKIPTPAGEFDLSVSGKNVLALGCKGNGIHDDTNKLQKIISKGGIVLIPAVDSYYKVSKQIVVPSNTKIIGINGQPLIYNTSSEETNLFLFDGVENVVFENIALRNGTSKTTGGHGGEDKCGIKIENSENITVQNCLITEIEGMHGISAIYSKNLKFLNNRFYKCTYSMLFMGQETEDIHVIGNEFDTLTTTDLPNSYTFCTGVTSYEEEYNFRCRNIYFINNKVKNNPRWEGFDSHGVVGCWVKNNTFENVRDGIMVAHDDRGLIPFEHGQIFIEDNIILKGTGVAGTGGHGIVVQGSSEGIADHIVIKNNFIKGLFGNAASDYSAGLYLVNFKNGVVSENIVDGSINKAMTCSGLFNTIISNNKFLNTQPATEGANIFAVRLFSLWECLIKENVIQNKQSMPQVYRGFYKTSIGLINYLNNTIISTDTEIFDSYAMRSSVLTSLRLGKKGYYVTDSNDIKKYVCNDKVIRSNGQAVGGTISGTAGSNIVTTSIESFNILCPNIEIVITGAGAAGANLTTTVDEIIDKEHVKLKDNILTTVSNAVTNYTVGSWTAITYL